MVTIISGTTPSTKRQYLDCRDTPSESGCSLRISGRRDEVLEAAKQHAISVHGEQDTPELEKMLLAGMKDEEEPRRRSRPSGEAPATQR